MANDAYSQMALAESSVFQSLLAGALCAKALAVLAENGGAPTAPRKTLAEAVRDNPGTYAAAWSKEIAMNAAISAFTTSYDFKTRTVQTLAAQADILGVLDDEWDTRAGVA